MLEHVEQMLDESTGADCEARPQRGRDRGGGGGPHCLPSDIHHACNFFL